MLLFWRTQKRRKDKRQEPQGQRDSRHPQGAERKRRADERRGGRERERGAGGKQPLRLCRATNKINRSPERSESGEAAWALERERARKKTRSKAHRERKRPRRLAERLEDEARTTDARVTRARASKPRRNGAGKEREEKAAHVTNYPRSLRCARGGASTGSAAKQAGSRRKHPEAQAVRKDSDESAANSAGAQGADGGAERSRPTTKRDRRCVN